MRQRAVDYVNAGTVEFIADNNANFYFLEMNTRLQVEHPITEMVTGIDIVQAQLRIAAGEPLPFAQEDLRQRGHAIECRLYAEDPAQNFMPFIGKILKKVEPMGINIRVDSGVKTGDEISIHYDPMISKLIVLAENREQAIRKMDWALREYVLLGVTTNLDFLQDVICHDVFKAGEATTSFVDQYMREWDGTHEVVPDEALIVAALGEYLERATGTGANQASGTAEGDVYSPWQRADTFRMGQG